MESSLREQVKAALEFDNHENACFLSERLYACRPSEDNTLLLARCYARSRRDFRAVHVLSARGSRLSSRGRLMLAQARYRLNELSRAEDVIAAAMRADISDKYVRAEFHYLKGLICRNTNRVEDAVRCFAEALECNPLLWPAFKELCQFGCRREIKRHFERYKRGLKSQFPEREMSDSAEELELAPSVSVDEEMLIDGPEINASPAHTPHSGSASRRREPSPHTPQELIRPVFDAPLNVAAPPLANRPVTRQSARQRENPAARRWPPSRTSEDRPSVNDPAGPTPGKTDGVSSVDSLYYSADDGLSESQSVHKRGQTPSVHTEADTSMSGESENPFEPQNTSDGAWQMYQLFYKLHKGLFALSTYNLDKALKIFTTGLPGKQGETAWVLAKLGYLHMQRVDYRAAQKYFAKARHVDPTHVEDMDSYSSMLFLMEDAPQLSHLATELRKLDRLSPETWCVVGNLHCSLREQVNALAAFQRAVQLDRYKPYSYSLCGHVYIELEDYDKALQCFRTAMCLNTRQSCGWYGMGLVQHLSQKYEEAAEYYKKAVEINPYHSVFRLRHGMMLVQLKKDNEALAELQKATALDRKNKDAFLHKGKLHYSMKQYELAKAAFTSAAMAASMDPEVHYQLGLTYKKLNDRHKATETFYKGLDLNPSSVLKANIQAAIENINEADDDPVNKY